MDMEEPPDSDAALESAIFGKQVENFIDSALGRYLVRYAEGKVEAAVEALKCVDSLDAPRIKALQGDVALWESFQQRLAEAVMEGVQATKLIEER